MYKVEDAPNYEQKCLCMLVVDVSGSMAGEPINQLNKGLQDFQEEVSENLDAAQRLEVGIVTFGSAVTCIQHPSLISDVQIPKLTTNGSTKLVDGVRLAMTLIDQRKRWYKETGQKYHRPMIFLITDGEPDPGQDIDGLSQEVASKIASKNFMFYSVGVKGYNHQRLSKICSTPPPLPLDGLKFSEFFKWVSNSIDGMLNSKEGEILMLPPVSGWTQMQI